MARIKGSPKVPGSGRKKGSWNKETKRFTDELEAHGFSPVKALITIMPDLNSADKAQVLIKMLEFQYPKLRAVEQKVEDVTPPGQTEEVHELVEELNKIISDLPPKEIPCNGLISSPPGSPLSSPSLAAVSSMALPKPK